MPVITMLSPKGGVGKTTTALVLATELAAEGAQVIIIDADPNFPLMIPKFLLAFPRTFAALYLFAYS